MNLDDYFRRESAARVIAERLLTGKPQSRQQLVDGLGVTVTTVNRVVEVLARAGARVNREIADDGHQAVFRVVSVSEPLRKQELPTVRDEVTFVGVSLMGEDTMIEFEVGRSRYKGALKSLGMMPPLRRKATVQQVSLVSDDLADMVLKADGQTRLIVVESVQNVT